MNTLLLTIVTFAVAFISVALIHPYLVRFAKAKNIVDNPNTRKIQLRPVPVLGGLAIFFGIVVGVLAAHSIVPCSDIFVILACMMIMTYVGALDDVLDISPIIRLISQIITVLILIYIGGLSLNNFHGLWGINSLSAWVYVPLTIVSVVGLINSVNLIDGADGLFSIFCISVCAIFLKVVHQNCCIRGCFLAAKQVHRRYRQLNGRTFRDLLRKGIVAGPLIQWDIYDLQFRSLLPVFRCFGLLKYAYFASCYYKTQSCLRQYSE